MFMTLITGVVIFIKFQRYMQKLKVEFDKIKNGLFPDKHRLEENEIQKKYFLGYLIIFVTFATMAAISILFNNINKPFILP